MTITLPPGASAEWGTCGSCRFFRRGQNVIETYGKCCIELPPKYALKPEPRDEDHSSPSTMRDDQRCELFQHTGETYIVQREVYPISPRVPSKP